MDHLQCEVNRNCRQPVELKLDGKYICGVHWKKRCDDDERAWVEAQLAPHAGDPFHLDYLTQLHGVKR
jgi:hypothetical protein